MANTADYSAMSYKKLLELLISFNWGLMMVKFNLKLRRLEEMSKITHAYVTAMDGYDATKSEIMACLEKEGLKEKHSLTFFGDEADCQCPIAETVNADGEESLPDLPESPADAWEDAEVIDSIEAVPDDTGHIDGTAENESIILTPAEAPVPVVSEGMENGVNEDDAVNAVTVADTSAPVPDYKSVYAKAIEVLRSSAVPVNINVNAPYFVKCDLGRNKIGDLENCDITGKNLSMEDLAAFRHAAERYVSIIHKDCDMISTEDSLAFRTQDNSVNVLIYNFPGDIVEDVTSANTVDADKHENSIVAFTRKKKELSKKHSKMRKVMKILAEYSESIGVDSDRPSYDRCFCKCGHADPEFKTSKCNIEEDAETLAEMSSVFETYSKVFYDNAEFLSEGDCFAVMLENEDVYAVKINLPGRKKPAESEKKTKKAVEKVDAVPCEDSLIAKAVETARSMSVGKYVDVKSPYIMQCEFKIGDEGEIIKPERSFTQKIAHGMMDGTRRRFEKRAQTYKASLVSSADDYSAYVWNGGKSVTVCLYHEGGSEA